MKKLVFVALLIAVTYVVGARNTEAQAVTAPAEPTFNATCTKYNATRYRIILTWNKVSGATEYPVRLKSPTGIETVIGNPTANTYLGKTVPPSPTATYYMFSNLTKAGTYTFWGHAWNSAGWSGYTQKTVVCGKASTPVSSTPTTLTTLPSSFFTGITADRIFQRGSDGKASIVLTKSSSASDPSSSYRIVKVIKEGGTVVSTGEKELTPYKSTVTVKDGTGMEYHQIVVSYYNANDTEVARYTSPRFAVGEVFIAAGQSNAATHGAVSKSSRVSMNKTLDTSTGTWVPLRDPMPIASNFSMSSFVRTTDPAGFAGGSSWPEFSDIVSNALNVPVAVVSVGWGGSSVDDWKKGSTKNLYPRLTAAANLLSSCSFRAVLWHQGETDSINGTTKADYKTRMKSVISSFQTDTGCKNEWFVSQASWMPGISSSKMTPIKTAQIELAAEETSIVEGPNTDAYTLYPEQRYDNIHFSDSGLTLLAQLWAQKVGSQYGLPVPMTLTVPQKVSAIPAEPAFTASCVANGSGWDITVSWNNTAGSYNYPLRVKGLVSATNVTTILNQGDGLPVSVWGMGILGDDAPTGLTAPQVTKPTFVAKGFSKAGTYSVWMHGWNSLGWSGYTKKNVTCGSLSQVITTPTVLGVSSQCVNLPYNHHRGHESANVRMLQTFLSEHGLLGEVTGFYGDKTIGAVKAYQLSKGLPQTGMVYERTREAIKNDSCTVE